MNEMDGQATGARIQAYRKRAGMSRPVLAGLVGRSAEWVKAVETGRLQVPRLPMLLKIAHALDVRDLADLTGNGHAVPVATFAGEAHSALSQVQAALTDYRITPPSTPLSVPHLDERLTSAWQVRHASPNHRSALGSLLPDLIRDAQRAVRTMRDEERRDARRVLAGVYRLADFYVAYQPAQELVWIVADRAIAEAQEADDPYAIATGSWALVGALRDSGRWEEAISVALDACTNLESHLEKSSNDWRGIYGALMFEVAYVNARRGRYGEAWAYWERADRVAAQLGPEYRHTQTSFSQVIMKAHAVTLGVELSHPGEALKTAEAFDADLIPSIPRRSRHLIEVARAHAQRNERVATLALLDKAECTAPETIRFNGYARAMALDLVAIPPASMRSEVADLSRRLSLKV